MYSPSVAPCHVIGPTLANGRIKGIARGTGGFTREMSEGCDGRGANGGVLFVAPSRNQGQQLPGRVLTGVRVVGRGRKPRERARCSSIKWKTGCTDRWFFTLARPESARCAESSRKLGTDARASCPWLTSRSRQNRDAPVPDAGQSFEKNAGKKGTVERGRAL